MVSCLWVFVVNKLISSSKSQNPWGRGAWGDTVQLWRFQQSVLYMAEQAEILVREEKASTGYIFFLWLCSYESYAIITVFTSKIRPKAAFPFQYPLCCAVDSWIRSLEDSWIEPTGTAGKVKTFCTLWIAKSTGCKVQVQVQSAVWKKPQEFHGLRSCIWRVPWRGMILKCWQPSHAWQDFKRQNVEAIKNVDAKWWYSLILFATPSLWIWCSEFNEKRCSRRKRKFRKNADWKKLGGGLFGWTLRRLGFLV